MTTRQALSSAFALALAGLLSACGGGGDAEQIVAAPVIVEKAQVGDMEERIAGTGELAAPDRALIAAEVDGRITDVHVDEGARVKAGDVLLTIDPEKRSLDADSARAQARDAEAGLEVAVREFERAQALHEQGIASDSVLDLRGTELSRARARRDSAVAARGVAEKLLRDASVRAPFGGLVAKREVSRGDYVRPGQQLLEVVALDPIEVEFSVAERDTARVAPGQPVTVSVEPYPNERFVGAVSAVSPVIDPRTRTMRVKARIPNADGRLRPGLFARTDLGVAKSTDVEVANARHAVAEVVAQEKPLRDPVARAGHEEGIPAEHGLHGHERLVLRQHTTEECARGLCEIRNVQDLDRARAGEEIQPIPIPER